MLRKLYNWTMDLAAHHNAKSVLALVAFIESSVFPIPPDILLIPMVLAKRAAAWSYAAICTIASVLGGAAGWLIGYFLFETLGEFILEVYNMQEAFLRFQDVYAEWGFWIVFGAGLTPFPYKVITIASGVMGLSLPIFVIGSVLSRGLRFFAVAGLLYLFGEKIRYYIEKYMGLMATAFFILLIGGFILIKYI